MQELREPLHGSPPSGPRDHGRPLLAAEQAAAEWRPLPDTGQVVAGDTPLIALTGRARSLHMLSEALRLACSLSMCPSLSGSQAS